MGIGVGIKFFREQYNLNYADLESLAGIDADTLEAIENETIKPSVQQIEPISTALGVSIPALIFQGISPENIPDPEKRGLLLELRPYFEAIAVELYVSKNKAAPDEAEPDGPSASL